MGIMINNYDMRGNISFSVECIFGIEFLFIFGERVCRGDYVQI